MISFSHLTKDFQISEPDEKKDWIKKVIEAEGKNTGDLQFVLCNDNYLSEINLKYLKHNTLTDIITFSSSTVPSIISGDIFISIERVRENADALENDFEEELSKVLIHGVLHLIGYDDHTVDEKRQMRSKEDYYLHLQP